MHISHDLVKQIKKHGERTYPNECCGVLFGCSENELKALRLKEMVNINKELPSRRYDIDPRDLLQAEKEAESLGLELIGIYHSHPDHPARPSQYDLEHAWPNLSYIIVSVQKGKANDFASWRLDSDNKKFIKEKIVIIEEKTV